MRCRYERFLKISFVRLGARVVRRIVNHGGHEGSLRKTLSSSKCEQRDFRRNSEPHWEAKRAQPAVDIKKRSLPRVAVDHGKSVETGDKIRDQTRRADGVVHDFEFYLPSMGVAGEAEIDSKFRS